MFSECNAMTILQFDKTPKSILNCDTTETNNCEQDSSYAEQPSNLLCLILKNGKIGSSYFVFEEKLLNYYEDVIDVGPQYILSMNIFYETRPKYVLTFGSIADDFVKVLIDLFTTGINATTTSDSIRNIPENFFLLPAKEYTYDVCKAVISQLYALNDNALSEIKREVYIHSCINFDYRLSVQAIGTVVKFLEKNWTFFNIDKADLQYLCINQVTLKNRVFIDKSTYSALNIFSQYSHDSGFKRGAQSASREGLSVYKLFSAHCKSRIGLVSLRNILTSPISCLETLGKRLEFIDFVLQPQNREYVESIQDNMKELGSDVNSILKRIENLRGTSRDWNILYKTIYHSIFIDDISAPYRDKIRLLQELNDKITSDLIGLENSIDNSLDFSPGQRRGRPIIKFGLDEILDAKKIRQQDISKDVTAAARFAANNLPDFLNECAIIYLPEMGHLIAIKEWEPNCDPDLLQELGFNFMFTLRGTIHYKNPLCVELDKRLGDINAEIIDHENRILRRLSGFILKHKKDILEPVKAIGLLDCLISMAIEASQNSYICPILNSENIIDIQESRHLLMEHNITNYQPNNFLSGGNHSKIKIITGPNGSGKSMYLRQIALIIFLAHVGSYVPALYANIALLNSIYSRIRATESAAVRLSAFMIDVTQISHALNNPISRSLILLDEFGKGTSDVNGIVILASVLKMFIERGTECPHVLLATHFQQVANHLPSTPLITYQKMEYTKDKNGLSFLYKIVEGISMSFGFDIAEMVILDDDIISRAREIMSCLNTNEPIRPLEEKIKGFDAKNLDNLDVPEPDEHDITEKED